MKKIIVLLSWVMLMVSMTGCVSQKKIRYFQGADTLYAEAQRITQQYEMRLKPADQIYIKVTCSEPELLAVVSQGVAFGNNANTGGVSYTTGLNAVNGFTIDNEGMVNLPKLGKVHVSGLTTEECAKVIEKHIIEEAQILDAEVTVYLLNARVTVIGSAGSSRVVNLTSERNTIVDILAQCGDIADTGHRYNIRLFRENDGMRKMYKVDLTKADVFQNPAYYVQQNDLIYVEPNKSKSVKSSAFYTFMSAGTSILAAIMSCISFIYIFKK